MRVTEARRAPAECAARVGSVSQIFVECFGSRVRVSSDDAELLEMVRRRLPPCARVTESRTPDISYRVRTRQSQEAGPSGFLVLSSRYGNHEGGRVASASDALSAATALVRDLEFRVALQAPAHIFVHAAAVVWHGRVISLPGRSHCGKSTLTAALIRAGARYFSDEFTVLDENGLVHPFARPLQLRCRDGVRQVPIDQLSPDSGVPRPLGLVVHTRFRAGAAWNPRSLGTGDTALALLENAVVARTRPRQALAHIARALEPDTTGLHGDRGDADETARSLLENTARLWDGMVAR